MTLNEKAALVAKIEDGGHPSYEFHKLVVKATDDAYHTFTDGEALYGDETYGASLTRYYKLGYISDDTVEELYMRAVLAGLHNKIGEEQ